MFLEGYNQVLEIGSGTGQHAVYFAEKLPHLKWQTSDQRIHHEGINMWLNAVSLANALAPIELDLHHPWPAQTFDVIYSANTFHIISKKLVEAFFKGVDRHLPDGGVVCIYGPFKYKGQFTSDSNAQFDALLKSRDSNSGIRDIEWVISLAKEAKLELQYDHAMPANNQLLLFKRQLS